MEIFIAILLGVIVVLLINIQSIIKAFIKAYIADKNIFDPDFPFHSRDVIYREKKDFERIRREYDEASQKYHEYYDVHREEIEKVKNNKDLSNEFKEIVRSYFEATENFEKAAADYWFDVETNYAIRNSKMTANDVSDAFDKHLEKNHPIRHKSRYKQWLEKGIE
jgi:hypothetical protein